MLHCVVTFDEKCENLPTFVISYILIRGTKIVLSRHYENLDFQKKYIHIQLKKIGTMPKLVKTNYLFLLKKKSFYHFFHNTSAAQTQRSLTEGGDGVKIFN